MDRHVENANVDGTKPVDRSEPKRKEPTAAKNPWKMALAGLIFSIIMRVIYYTSRKRYSGRESFSRLLRGDQPVIMVAWHDRNALVVYAYLAARPRGRRIIPLASASRDGALAVWAMRGFGIPCVRGSSSKGGFGALKQLMKILKAGDDVAFTPDGPRGPRYSVQGGVITAAKMTGAPIVPVAYGAKRKKLLGTWDRLMFPYPFNRLHFVYGEPLYVPRNCPAHEIEGYAAKLKTELLRICEVSERF